MTTVNSLNSHLGLAKQTAKGTPETSTANFTWFLARRIGGGPMPRQSPLPYEIGGGMLVRGQVKLGVNAGAGLQYIPRASSIGHLLLGVAGKVTSGHDDAEGVMPYTSLASTTQEITDGLQDPPVPGVVFIQGLKAGATLTGDVTVTGTDDSDQAATETLALNGDTKVTGAQTFKTVTQVDLPVQVTAGDRVAVGFTATYYVHEFEMDSDPAVTPYWTVRRTVGSSFGETISDCRVGGLVLDMAAVNWIESQTSLDGIEPVKETFASQAEHDAYVGEPDSSPLFVSALGDVRLNGLYEWKHSGSVATLPVRSATLTVANQHAIDEEFVVGSYFPRDIEILSRTVALQYITFVQDAELYGLLMYDPDGGAEWLADVFASSEARITFRSPSEVAAGRNYELAFRGEKSEWLVEPIELRENGIVMVRVSGMIVAPGYGKPFVLTLRNNTASY
jgi:hypothetical protein